MQQLDFSSVGAIPANPPKKDHVSKPSKVLDFSSVGAIAAAPKSASSDEPAGPSVQELASSNPHNEGLYRMKGADGKVYGVPHSSVEQVSDFRNNFVDEKEAERYEKNANPGWWSRVRDKVEEVTEPTDIFHGFMPSNNPMDPVNGEMAVNTLKRVGRGAFGLVDLTPQIYGMIQDMASDDPVRQERGESAIQNIHPGAQVVDRVREFKKDYKKDPKLAVANTAGDALVIYLTDKAAEALRATPEAVRGKVLDSAKRMTGTGSRATRADVAARTAENEHIELDAREIKEANDKIVANAKTEAEKAHAAKVAEVREKNAKSAAKHAEKVESIIADNNQVHETAKAAHEKELGEVREKNAAATKAAAEHQRLSEEAHAAKVKETEEKNLKAQEAHEKAVAEKDQIESRKAEIARKKLELRTRIFDRIKAIKDAGKEYFDKQYDTVEKATENLRAPINPLIDAVYDAKADKIEGSDTKVPIFEDILKKAKGESGSGGTHTEGYDDLAPDEKAILARGRGPDASEGITYKDLRGYDRELGKVIGSPNAGSDIRQAAIKVQKVIRDMQQGLADEAGVGSTQKKLGTQYKNYAETFFDNSGPSGSGSPVAQAAKAADAHNATEPFLKLEPHEMSRAKKLLRGVDPQSRGGSGGTAADWVHGEAPGDAGARGKNWRQYRWDTAKLVEQLDRLNREERTLPNTKEITPPEPTPTPEFKLLPKAPAGVRILPEPEFEEPTLAARKLKAIPEAPEPIPEPEFKPASERPAGYKEVPQPKTLSEERLKINKRTRLDAAINKMEKPSILGRGLGYAGVGSAVGLLAHLFVGSALADVAIGAGASFLSEFGRLKIADLLSKPWVRESLTRITAADIEELNKLPANEQIKVEKTMGALAQEARRTGVIKTISPWVAFARRDRSKSSLLPLKPIEDKPEPAEPDEEVQP